MPEHEADLTETKCVPCRGDVPPLEPDQIEKQIKKLGEHSGWEVVDNQRLEKIFTFDVGKNSFKKALEFTNRVGELAENEGHHPNIELSWGKVKITLWTHKINGLHQNDFIMAAKINKLR